MKINVEKLLEERIYIPLGISKKGDLWIDKILKDDLKECSFIGTLNFLNKQELLRKYYISGIFSIANPYNEISIPFYVYTLSKRKPKEVLIGVYKDKIRFDGTNNFREGKNYCSISKNLPISYKEYLKRIEIFVSTKKRPKNRDNFDFNMVKTEEFFYENIDPSYYTEEAKTIRDLIKKEDTIPLQTICNVIRPKRITTKIPAKYLSPSDFEYPLNYEKLKSKDRTDTQLHKGDILVKVLNNFNSYLIDEEPKEPIFALSTDFVLRIKNNKYSPEYLQLYLNSNLYKKYINQFLKGTGVLFVSKQDLLNIPVIEVQKNKEFYLNLFKYVKNPINCTEKYDDVITDLSKNPKLETMLILEKIQDSKCNRNIEIQKLFQEDLQEVKKCFECGAYKATLILCGSILEAFLLDWLNTLEPNEDWLNKEYVIDQRTGNKIKVALNVCINRIAKLKKPEWMEEKNKAIEIRNQRNNVHAKLCLKESVEINETICAKVIQYLDDIIQARG